MATRTASDVSSYSMGADTATASGRVSLSLPYPNVDRTAPVAAVNTPAAGSTLPASSTALVVDVTDASALQRVIIFASFSDGTRAEMVYDGSAFRTAYLAGSSVSSITGGLRFSLVRASGWRSNPSLSFYAIDDSAPSFPVRNEMNFTTFSWVYAADTAGPTMAAYSPANGATLASKASTIAVDVTDTAGLARVLLLATFADSGVAEVVWDGSAQGPGYSVATASITNGTRFTVARTMPAGWRVNPTFKLYALDAFGNETLLATRNWVFSPDNTAPVLGSASPAAGSSILATASVAFHVTDASDLEFVLVRASFADGTEEIVYDGTLFSAQYLDDSTVTPISGGFAFVLVRLDGWLEDLEISVFTRDTLGNELAFDDASLAWNSPPPPPPDLEIPTITVVTPAAGSPIGKHTPIVIETTDDVGLGAAFVFASYGDSETLEVVFDGVSFTPNYEGSTRTDVTGGFRFTVVRRNGWPASAKLTLRAVDTSGKVAT